jgi:hypothetical protein
MDNLRRAMENTKIMCAVMLDTKVSCSTCNRSGVAAAATQQQLQRSKGSCAEICCTEDVLSTLPE